MVSNYIEGLADAMVVEASEYNLVKILSPKITIDGNKWSVVYGENIQDGVCGFGETPYLAVLDFNNAWQKENGNG